MKNLTDPPGWLSPPDEIEDEINYGEKFLYEVDGPYFVYGPDDKLYDEIELGRELAKDGYDYYQLTHLDLYTFTSRMRLGFKQEKKSLNEPI